MSSVCSLSFFMWMVTEKTHSIQHIKPTLGVAEFWHEDKLVTFTMISSVVLGFVILAKEKVSC